MRVIVSIASYDKRISTLYLCLETIFAQTFKPDKILIYLDKKYEALPFDTKNVLAWKLPYLSRVSGFDMRLLIPAAYGRESKEKK